MPCAMPFGPDKIPYGYKLIQGQAQKGDGVWNGERFVRVKKVYPSTEPAVIIRRQEVVQTEMETDGC